MSEPKYNSITAAVKAQARQARRDAKAAAQAARTPKVPAYHPNAVNLRSHTLARILAKYRTRGVKFSSSSLQICRRRAQHDAEFVGVSVSTHGDKKTASLNNVFFCNNSIHCPHCSAKREAKTRDYLNNGVSPAAKSKRLSTGLLTITCRHTAATAPDDLYAYKPLADAFYSALSHFHSNSYRIFDALGGGYIAGIEAPMGAKGLHIHSHEAIFFDAALPKAERDKHIAALKAKAIAAFKRAGLHISASCLDFQENYDLGYIAKSGTNEIHASDDAATIHRKRADYELTRKKTNHGHSNNREFVEHLDDAKHDKAAEIEVVRHLLAMGGRDRWIVSRRLTKLLGIPSLSDYKATHGEAKADAAPKKMVAEMHPEAFNLATESINQRPAVALILRAAKNEDARPGTVGNMVHALVNATMHAHEARITAKVQSRTDAKIEALKAVPRHESITRTFVAAIVANGQKETIAAIKEYRASIAQRLRPVAEMKAEREMRVQAEQAAQRATVEWLANLTPAELAMHERMQAGRGNALNFS